MFRDYEQHLLQASPSQESPATFNRISTQTILTVNPHLLKPEDSNKKIAEIMKKLQTPPTLKERLDFTGHHFGDLS